VLQGVAGCCRVLQGAAADLCDACVTTVAGSAEQGKVDGIGASARFHQPKALALDKRGRLFVTDENPENKGCVRFV